MLRIASRVGSCVGVGLRRSAAAALAPSRRLSSGLTIPGTPRKLADVTKLDLLEQEEPSRIGAIWEAFHQEGAAVAGDTVGPDEADAIATRGAESPTFIFPLRRDGGHFMLFSQYAPASRMFVFTYLEDYRRSPEMAQPWASVHLFDEFVTTKAIGLLRAEVVPERLTTAEADHLLLLIRRYYGTSNYDRVRARALSPRGYRRGAQLTPVHPFAMPCVGLDLQPLPAAFRPRRVPRVLPMIRS